MPDNTKLPSRIRNGYHGTFPIMVPVFRLFLYIHILKKDPGRTVPDDRVSMYNQIH